MYRLTLQGANSDERTSPTLTSMARTVPKAGDLSGVPEANSVGEEQSSVNFDKVLSKGEGELTLTACSLTCCIRFFFSLLLLRPFCVQNALSVTRRSFQSRRRIDQRVKGNSLLRKLVEVDLVLLLKLLDLLSSRLFEFCHLFRR